MIYLDTGYLVALVNVRDELHSRALAWSRFAHGPFLLSEFILLESIDALSQPRFRPMAHQLISGLQKRGNVIIEPLHTHLLQRGMALHRARPDKHWSLTDCISFTLMQDHGITQAFAYDLHFEQAGFEALLRRDP